MPIKFHDYPLNEGEYVKTVTSKTHVVWHGTMGRTRDTPYKGLPGKGTSSIDGWNNDSLGRVGATYLVDRDATIYRCFDDKYWVYHLGLSGTNGKYDKKSVGIEMANELCLLKNSNKYYAFEKVSQNSEYVGKVFNVKWRDWEYWAALDKAQVDACIALTLDICSRYGITPSFYKPSTTYDYPACFTKATIICHSNCRKDKTDLILEDWVYDKIKAAGITLVDK